MYGFSLIFLVVLVLLQELGYAWWERSLFGLAIDCFFEMVDEVFFTFALHQFNVDDFEAIFAVVVQQSFRFWV